MGNTGHDRAFDWWFYCWMAMLIAWLLYAAVASWWRDRQLVLMAGRIGLTRPVNRLPNYVSIDGTTLEEARRFRNVMLGKRVGVEVVIFDCTFGSGKGRWSRTVVGARSLHDPFNTMFLNHSLTTERSNEWLYVYAPKEGFRFVSGVMSVHEIQALMAGVTSHEQV